MLILTRRTGEEIDMTDEEGRVIVVTFLGVVGNQVRVGISARKSVTIDRHEVTLRKRREALGEEADGNVAEPPEEEEQARAEAPPRPPPAPGRQPLIRLKKKFNVDSLERRRQLEEVE